MKTMRRLIYGEILVAVAFVTLGFLSLFFFFDLVEEIQSVGRHAATGYKLVHALSYVALIIPSHLYELMPIAVLIGTIFVMARLAQSSEFTILRTSGLGPGRWDRRAPGSRKNKMAVSLPSMWENSPRMAFCTTSGSLSLTPVVF